MMHVKDHVYKLVWLAVSGVLMLGACTNSVPTSEANLEQATEVIQEPTATAVKEVPGIGNFPRMFVVAPTENGVPYALYLVEGSSARKLLVYGDYKTYASIACQPSPDGLYAACLIEDAKGITSVEIVDSRDSQRNLIGKGLGPLSPNEKGGPFEDISSIAWLDREHLLYAKITTPREFFQADWDWGTVPLPPLKGEVWLSNLDGTEQRLLLTAPIYRILGASPDLQTLYVTRLLPGREDWRMQGFSLLDVASGELENLWPAEKIPGRSIYSFNMIRFPDGSPRITFVEAGPPGTTTSKDPPVVWIGDPQTRQAKPAWKMDHADEHTVNGQVRKSYYGGDYLVSPDSGSLFVYSTLGVGYIVNIEDGQEQDLGTVTGKLSIWSPQGIVTQNSSVIRLLNTNREEIGLIRFVVLLP